MSFIKEFNVITVIAAESKTSEKLAILKDNKELLEKIVFYALDFTKKYNIKKFPPKGFKLGKFNRKAIFNKLDQLSKVRGASYDDSYELASYCSSIEDLEVVRRILNKDLRCGINLKSASKAYPDLPTKDIMLCGKAARVIVREGKRPRISPELEEFVESCGGWSNVGISDKEDGVRDKIVIKGTDVAHISRNGLTYNNFGIFDEAILHLKENVELLLKKGPMNDLIFDGEVISDDEDFQKQMTQIRRIEDADPSIFRLRLFDIPTLKKYTQAKRESILRDAYEALPKKFKRKIELTLCYRVKDKSTFLRAYDEVVNIRKKEGVVLKNLKGLYENKRSSYWCKVKTFFSIDLKVIGVNKGKPGKKYAGVLGALVVYFEGREVCVGSGYSDKQRVDFLDNPPKMIEIEYKSITKDGSLYIPTFVRERSDRMV
jgi:hypothetical protein